MTPQLDLAFGHHPHAGTVLTRRRVRWPYVLTNPFRLDDVPAGMLTVILQSASGAVVMGDSLSQRIRLGAGAALHLTTQGATAIHSMPPPREAQERIELEAEALSLLEYLPEPRILFPGAALRQTLRLRLHEDATALVADGFVAHDPSGGDASFRRLASELVLERPDGRRLAIERFDLAGMPAWTCGLRAFGSFLVACPRDRLAPEALAAAVPAGPAYAAVSALPHDAGWLLRIAAPDGGHLRQALDHAWQATRKLLTGAAAASRRKQTGFSAAA